VRRTELKVKGKTSFPQHEQGLGALRSNRITHMTPRMQGLVRQAQAPIKKPALGDETIAEKMMMRGGGGEAVASILPRIRCGDEEREGVGPWPEPPRIAPSQYVLEPEED
jgi:hypothetical protein